ncbi:uncharacterized protein LOC107263087 isoform X1 [Cephus cinctus]|uniref:Uncharacterized protein LOC107263087 isoform X1 n=1 Tax=Cephus cinctus TaxID=211228 RepID=A0AAJ7R9A9_CEPCN|nr:uncharacterized protein LOC107263087 isoform X1 [Cephus cinctus]
MENSNTFGICTLANHVFELLTGTINVNATVIKINSENLSVNGELCFLTNLQAWKNFFTIEASIYSKCTSILEYLLHSRGQTFQRGTNEEIAETVFRELVAASAIWHLRIEKCTLQKERVCVFLNRSHAISTAITMFVSNNVDIFKNQYSDKSFSLKVETDKESDLTNVRLCLIRDVAENLMKLQGCKISETSNNKYIITSKSQSKTEDSYNRYVCGVVKNSEANAKEIKLTWELYLKEKKIKLSESFKQKCSTINEEINSVDDINSCLAQAEIVFELLAVKPSRTVFIKSNTSSDRSVSNTKGVSFIFYNLARISAIWKKYITMQAAGRYPKLTDINNVDFSSLNQEEEWELVYNFIIGYPDMIRSCIRYEPDFELYPQTLCHFLGRLCQKFSAYYRRIRVLTEGGNHQVPAMTARLYLLKALDDILLGALKVLHIRSVPSGFYM